MLATKKSIQIGTVDERGGLKAVCLSWLKNHRVELAPFCDSEDIGPIDAAYQSLLSASEGHPSRKRACDQLKAVRKRLVLLRSKVVLVAPTTFDQDDKPPSFAKLASDPEMQDILIRRWDETTLCMKGGADLAAVVMMGGLLESLLLARINVETNKAPIFTALNAPKDKKTGATLPLKDWTLRDYIDVEHELGWITKSTKDVGEVLRDWRDYIHPHKEHSHKIKVVKEDANLFWSVAKTIAQQVIASVP